MVSPQPGNRRNQGTVSNGMKWFWLAIAALIIFGIALSTLGLVPTVLILIAVVLIQILLTLVKRFENHRQP